MRNSEPLPNELEKIKRVYIIFAVCLGVGLIFGVQFLMTIGGMGLIGWFMGMMNLRSKKCFTSLWLCRSVFRS